MSITWFSPLDAESSEIARYSAQLMPVLQSMANVLAVDAGTGSSTPHWWRPPPGELRAEPGVAPMPIYHIGNNPLHLPIYRQSLREPGLVVLHDLSLVDLARHLSHQLEQPDLWKELMCRQYGDEIRALVNRSEKSVPDYNEMVSRYPLFQPFLSGALGVVVHSRHALTALQRQLPSGTPLTQLNLPALAPAEKEYRVQNSSMLRFVFCGHVGPNRRLLEFMEAWSQLANPGGISLDLFGNISNNRQLLQYAEHFGVAEYIRFRGYVADAELDAALQSADFAINLRWPTMGEASASQLRYWSAALPTLVSDVGWYSELPDDAVCKISVANESGDLLAFLENAVEEPARYRQVGLRGREQLGKAHCPEQYAQQLVSMADTLSAGRLAYRMLDQDLVTAIASMCENDNDARLFRDAIETAAAVCEVRV